MLYLLSIIKFFFITFKDVEFIFEDLRERKADGNGKIKNMFIKEMPNSGLVRLSFIINACVKMVYFPKSGKINKIVLIDTKLTNSYRPINLLSSISKIYKKS